MTPTRHSEIQEMLAAFSLDALEPTEADAVEVHLRDCPRCRAEVADHRETAALLAFGGVEAPPGVWEKIQAALEEAPPELELARVVPIRGSRWRSVGPRLTAAAAVLISLVALRVATIEPKDGPADTSIDAAIARAAVDPQAKHVNLVAAQGSDTVKVVLLRGRAYVADHSLPALRPEETYQLWGQKGDTFVSLGVLGAAPERGQVAASGEFDALAITVEVQPGVVQTSHPAVVAGWVPTD